MQTDASPFADGSSAPVQAQGGEGESTEPLARPIPPETDRVVFHRAFQACLDQVRSERHDPRAPDNVLHAYSVKGERVFGWAEAAFPYPTRGKLLEHAVWSILMLMLRCSALPPGTPEPPFYQRFGNVYFRGYDGQRPLATIRVESADARSTRVSAPIEEVEQVAYDVLRP